MIKYVETSSRTVLIHSLQLYANNMRLHTGKDIINKLAISSLGERIKHMNIISHAEGYLMKLSQHVSPLARLRGALRKFEEALDVSPLNKGHKQVLLCLTDDF